jgi:tripartite-type tricarboxylate transporter receptor subunit TctC
MKPFIKSAIAFVTGMLIMTLPAYADWKPTKPINVFIGMGAGGGVDTLARVIINKMGENTGWNFAAFNKVGGGGSVMLRALKNEAPDGYTIGFSPGENFTFNPTINPQIGYTKDDFTHLAAISTSQCALTTMVDKPWRTFEDVIADAKKGQRISVAYQAPKMGMSMNAISKVFGIEFQLIPVQGGADGIKNLLGGHVDIAWGAGIQTKYVEAGTMRVLASCESERLAMAPDAPTMQELGVKYIDLDAMFQFSGPANMPPEIVEAHIRELRKATQAKEVQELIGGRLMMKTIFVTGAELEKSLAQSLLEARELTEFVKK